MAYTIRLIGLECFRAEEVDGDEIFIKLNGKKVWEANPDKMLHAPESDGMVSQYDFAGARKRTRAGWIPLMPYQPGQFVFRDQTGDSELQLWDADVLTSDDLLGQTPIDASQASGGNISVVFQRLGAHYRLTYKVEAQA
ncbi:MAG: hypothetical protein U0521_28510 [Anaerolineae bacterium]